MCHIGLVYQKSHSLCLGVEPIAAIPVRSQREVMRSHMKSIAVNLTSYSTAVVPVNCNAPRKAINQQTTLIKARSNGQTQLSWVIGSPLNSLNI